MNWTEEAFWRCSWSGFLDAWNGYSRFALGLDPDGTPVTRQEAEALERELLVWQNGGG